MDSKTTFSVSQHNDESLIWWFNQYATENIDFDPTYQRGGVIWDIKKKSKLINSIINGYDIPKIYIADFRTTDTPLNEVRRKYAVIDGKQRFNAVFGFIKGEYTLTDDFIYEDDKAINLTRLDYVRLKNWHPEIAKKFDDYKFTVMSVIADDDNRIMEMFIRLNSGVSANRAEIRNAQLGIVPGMIRRLARHPFFRFSVSFKNLRLEHYNTAAKLLLFEYSGNLVDTKANDLDAFTEEGVDEKADATKFETVTSDAIRLLDTMSSIFKVNDPLLNASGQVGIYYWLVRYLLTKHSVERLAVDVRPFIDDFTKRVRANLRVSRKSPELADHELSQYYTFARSINDQKSLLGCFNIIRKQYDQRFEAKKIDSE